MVQAPRPSSRRVTALAVAAFAVATLSACSDVGSALGASRPQARQHANELASSLGARFGPVAPVEGFDDVRTKFSRSALTPSRLFRDTTIWSSSTARTRTLRLGGRPEGSRYVLGFHDLSRLTGQLAETRRTVELKHLAGNEYTWSVRDELVVGSASPDQLGATLTALLRAAEGTPSASAERALRTSFPNTSASLGRLVSLDRIVLERRADGATRVTVEASIHPVRVESHFPDYSRFLDRYLTRTKLSVVTEDATGADWLHASLSANQLTLEMVVYRGALAPLEGPARRMPDNLTARVDASTRVRVFGIGLSDLVGEVAIRRRPDEKSFVVNFRREPEWHLPLLVAQFIRAPLKRPFAEEGSSLGFSVTRNGHATVVAREYSVPVEESAIIRWIGDLGTTAISDFRQKAEAQHEQFIGEVFAAMRTDLDALLR